MVEANILIKNVETDSTGRMITITIDATVSGEPTREIRFSEMIGNLNGMTNAEVKQHFKRILQEVVRQRIGADNELDINKLWKRASTFVGNTFTINTDIPVPVLPTIEDIQYNVFIRDSDDPSKVWKISIHSGVIQVVASTVSEAWA